MGDSMQLRFPDSTNPSSTSQPKSNFLIRNESAFIAQFQENIEILLTKGNINPETIDYILCQLSHPKSIKYFRFALIAQQLIKVFGLLDDQEIDTLTFDIALALFALKILDDIADGEE